VTVTGSFLFKLKLPFELYGCVWDKCFEGQKDIPETVFSGKEV